MCITDSVHSLSLCTTGLNKHFHMVSIQHKLQQSVGVFLTTEQIWAHLRSLYDLDSLVSSSRLCAW